MPSSGTMPPTRGSCPASPALDVACLLSLMPFYLLSSMPISTSGRKFRDADLSTMPSMRPDGSQRGESSLCYSWR